MKIGVVDLDTSHPQSFLPLLRARGHEVVGVWDEGIVHPRGYAEEFAKRNGISKVFFSLEEMADHVDLAMLHCCNWDTHIAKALPFLERNRSVFIDKPLSGNTGDLATIAEWINRGCRISGGSSLLYCQEAREFKASRSEAQGKLHTVFCGCGVDLFNYGIHAFALASALANAPIASVRVLSSVFQQDSVELIHADQTRSLLQIGDSEEWLPFYATLVTTRQVTHFNIAIDRIYANALDETLPYLEGTTNFPPLSIDAWLQPERCALAALLSKKLSGRSISILDTRLDQVFYDGAAFARGYRDARYPQR